MAETPEQRVARERRELDTALTDALGKDDVGLLVALESLARRYRGVFPETVARWAPVIWKRDRVRFRPFLLAQITSWNTAPWKAAKGVLPAWIAEVEHVADDELFQRLYELQLALECGWGEPRQERMRADLLARWTKATDRASRVAILERFDLWFMLSEPVATALWQAEPDLAREYLATRLPSAARGWRGEIVVWKKLWEQAESRDPELYFALYRAQVPFERWKADVKRLSKEIADPGVLIDELTKRSPSAHGDRVGLVWAELLEDRGRDAIPYITPLLGMLSAWRADRPGWKAVIDVARRKEWLDLWVKLVAIGRAGALDSEVKGLLADRNRAEPEVRRRLRMLSSGAGEHGRWRSAGLSDDTATALYARFPDLARGPFRGQLVAHEPKKLLAAALSADDGVIIDLVAASYLNRTWKPAEAIAGPLVAHYDALPDAAFAARAGAVLGDMPAFGVWNYSALVRMNPLTHLLFERGAAKFLDNPAIVRDLFEAPQVHVQGLALRLMAKDDDRARIIAGMCVDLLAPTLLRRLHRRKRLWAIAALENAASTADNARLITAKAREALELPDDRYPKEALIGLIGRLLHRWPALRGRDEQPRIFRAGAP